MTGGRGYNNKDIKTHKARRQRSLRRLCRSAFFLLGHMPPPPAICPTIDAEPGVFLRALSQLTVPCRALRSSGAARGRGWPAVTSQCGHELRPDCPKGPGEGRACLHSVGWWRHGDRPVTSGTAEAWRASGAGWPVRRAGRGRRAWTGLGWARESPAPAQTPR